MRRIALWFAFALWLTQSTSTQAASPSIGMPTPRGMQRGTEGVLTFTGANLADAQELLFYSPGITVTKLEPVSATLLKATLKIAENAQLGEQVVRVRTASGLSNLMPFWLGALPTVEEKEPNSDFTAPQKIALNVTVTGVVQAEDVDYFALEAKKGQRISVEVEGMRLATTFFDPYIAILDAKRFELASSDDTPLFRQDGCLSIVAPADGTYIVQIRETSYGGNGSCIYRLHVGTFPRPTAVIPAGGKLGEEIEVSFLGDATGVIKQKVKLPTKLPTDGKFGLHCQDANGISPSALPFRLSDVGNTLEVEPNDTFAQATKGEFPSAFHGIIEKANDIDYFRFTGKKGQVFDVHCYARRLGAPLDPVMALYSVTPTNTLGGAVASNDDSGGPDSYFRVTLPADGDYVLTITDHLRKGGPTYTYRVEFTTLSARFDVTVPKVALYSQERQAFAVPRGNRFATMVNVNRVNVGGDVTLVGEGLPAKMTVSTEPMLANMTTVPVLFEAAPDAPLAGSLGNLLAKPVDEKVVAGSAWSQVAEYVISQPGQSIYVSSSVNKAAFAVVQEAPFKLSIVEPKVPLVQNGSMQLKVVAQRLGDFKGPITVVPLYNPPGVGSVSSVVIPEGQTEVLFALNANGGASLRKWKYAVLGSANPGSGVVWVSSQLANLEIAAPYVALKFERGAVEQGKETQLFVKIETTKPFEGKAAIKLIGLPTKVTTTDLELTKETKEIAFPIKADLVAPAGTHKNLFCQVVVTEQGEAVTHNLGTTELRVDVPLPPAKGQPAVTAKPATPTPPAGQPVKRLSRLEQLRLEQEEREKASKTPEKTPEPKK